MRRFLALYLTFCRVILPWLFGSAILRWPSRAMTRFLLIFALLATSLYGQDLEPNNSPSEAVPLGQKSLFRGSVGPGDPYDWFLVGDLSRGPVRLKATARMLTGALAGTDEFAFTYAIGTPPGVFPDSDPFPRGENEKTIHQVLGRYLPPESRFIYLMISSFTAGEYELNVMVEPFDKTAPNIRFEPYIRAHLRHEISPTQSEIRMMVTDGGKIRSVQIRSAGNPTVRLNPHTNVLSPNYVKVRYQLKRIRPSESLTIRVEDLAGNVRIRRVTFIRK